MQKLSIAAMGAILIIGVVGTAPAQAALLDFSFTTESSGEGSFTLDTDTPPASEPAITVNADGSTEEGVAYLNAIFNFSFSAPNTDISSPTTDFSIFPSIPLVFLAAKGLRALLIFHPDVF